MIKITSGITAILAFFLTTIALASNADPFAKRRGTSIFRKSSEDHGSHYFMARSAIGLERGDGFYKNTMVTLNEGSYAITSHLTVNAGADLFSIFISRNAKWFSRLQLHTRISDLFHVGVQAFYMAIPLPVPGDPDLPVDPSSGFASALGIITIGDPEFQLTLSGGPVHNGDRFARGPLLGVAAMARIGPDLALITEHWMLTDPFGNYPVHSIGLRVIGDLLAMDGGIVYDRNIAAKVLPFGSPFIAATLNF